MARYYADPEYRAQHNAKTSAREQARRANEPGYRESVNAKMRARRADPIYKAEFRERENTRARERYAADPEFRTARKASNAKSKRLCLTKTPLEKEVELALRLEVEKRGGMCPKFMDPARRGAPDRLVLLPGHPTYFVELKRPRRLGELKPWQVRYHADIRAAGQRVWTLWGVKEVDAFFAELDLCG